MINVVFLNTIVRQNDPHQKQFLNLLLHARDGQGTEHDLFLQSQDYVLENESDLTT